LGVEKNSSVPIYIQLKNQLKHAILSGEIKEGRKISSETQLAEKYQITRTTVRRAISELVNENLLRKEHGKGTFVRLQPVSHTMWNFNSFTTHIQKKDKIPVSEIIDQSTITIDGIEYLKLKRARGVKEDSFYSYLTIDTSLIPLSLFPGIVDYDFENGSLYEVMIQEYGISPDRVELSMKVQKSNEHAQKYFGIKKEKSLLFAEGQVFSKENEEIEKLQIIYSPTVDFKLATKIDPISL